MKRLIFLTIISLNFFFLKSQNYWQRTEGGGKKLTTYKNYIVALDPEIHLFSENGKYLKNLRKQHKIDFSQLFDYDSDEGYLWIATDSGLYKMDEFGYEKYLLDDEIAYGVAITDDNEVYAGGRNGLYIFQNGVFQLVNNSMKVYQMEYTDALYAFNYPSSRISMTGTHGLFSLSEFNEWIRVENEDLELTKSVSGIRLKTNLDGKLMLHLGKQGGLVYDKTNGVSPNSRIDNLNMDIYYADDNNKWIKRNEDKYLLKIVGSDTIYFSELDEMPKLNFTNYSTVEIISDLIIPNNKVYVLSDQRLYYSNSTIQEINGKEEPVFLDANKLKVGFETGFNLFNNRTTGESSFEVKHRNADLLYAGNLWLYGKDEYGDKHYFNPTFTDGFDFLNLGTLKNNIGVVRKISVKVNKIEIEYHQANFNKPGYTIPSGIKHWPANLYPQYGEKGDMAPYEDFNKNGIYDPENGDYPIIIGQEMVYMIFNDGNASHYDGVSKVTGTEIHIAAYAFNDTTQHRDQNIYLNVFVKNRSSFNYPSFQAAFFLDFDIGNPSDDYCGSDSANSIAYAYNGDDFDNTFSVDNLGFGENPPIVGVKPILENFYCIRSHSNGQYIYRTPYISYVFDGKNSDGTPYEELGKPTMYSFNGNPATVEGNTEAKLGINPSFRKTLVIWPKSRLNAGTNKAYNMVIGYNDDAPSGHHLSSFTNLVPQLNHGAKYIEEELDIPKEWEPRIRGKYTRINQQNNNAEYNTRLYPNPTNSYFKISSFKELQKVQLIDLSGRVVKQWNNPPKNMKYDTSKIKNGQYIVKCSYLNDEVAFKTQVLH